MTVRGLTGQQPGASLRLGPSQGHLLSHSHTPSEPPRRSPVTIDVDLVRRLVAGQFPQWADLPVRPVAVSGNDNRTFHLGDGMSVRLPSGPGYADQVDKEHQWLPRLAPHLPLPIPAPLARGLPAEGYPWRWSVYRWLPGETASIERIADLGEFARALAAFLTTLYGLDATGGPPPGAHNYLRGAPPAVYDDQTRRALASLEGHIDVALATEVWEAALASTWERPPVWVHGDVAAGNLLVQDGRLSAVIDFGCCAVGDPSCDLAIAWTLLDVPSREVIRAALPLDAGTWARGRGWALWKALITLAQYRESDVARAGEGRAVMEAVLEDHLREIS